MEPKYINIYYIITNIISCTTECLELIIQVISHSQHGQTDVWCISHCMIVHLSYLMCQSSHILVSDAANCIAGWLESLKTCGVGVGRWVWVWGGGCGCGEVGVGVGRCLWLWGGGFGCGEVGVRRWVWVWGGRCGYGEVGVGKWV